MNKLVDILKSYHNKVLFNEDGNPLTIEFRKGASVESILKFEIENDIKLPNDLRELLLFSNGVNLFSLQIHSIEEIEYFPHSKIISFHSWGNGDFDCVSIGGNYSQGKIVFMSHSEDKLALISNDLIEWVIGVIVEIGELGTLLHPLDYNEKVSKGMYKNVLC